MKHPEKNRKIVREVAGFLEFGANTLYCFQEFIDVQWLTLRGGQKLPVKICRSCLVQVLCS